MWRPPERIKHDKPTPRWPTAEEAAASRLFSDVAIGKTSATSRTWVPAMVPWRATEDGYVTEHVLQWYERFAKGQPGVIVVEATGIRDIPSGPLLRIGDDRFVDGLSRLVDTVHRASQGRTKLFIQLIDFLSIRRRPPVEKYFRRFWLPSDGHRQRLAHTLGEEKWLAADENDLREKMLSESRGIHEAVLGERELESLYRGYRERVWDTDLPHVAELPQTLPPLFAAAAERARAAGFDGVELHYAHAYTMASFLSRLNVRADGYGESLEGRARLPSEVLAAVKSAVGDDMVVGLRMLVDEAIAGGSTPADAAFFATTFCQSGADFISLSKGGKFEDAKQPKVGAAVYPYTGPSGYECMPTIHSDASGPFARNVSLMREVKQTLVAAGHEQPVVVAGGLCEFEQVEKILAAGDGDIIASARQSLADPDWFLKMREGRGAAIRRCDYTNYCEALDQKHEMVTCKLWDRKQLDEPDVPLDALGKRRLIAP